MASGVVRERKGPECTVEGSVPEAGVSIFCEVRVISNGGVANAGDITKESAITDGRVSRAFGVIDERGRSGGRIETTGRIVQKRCCTNGGVLHSLTTVLVSRVEKERPRTDSGVIAALRVAPE